MDVEKMTFQLKSHLLGSFPAFSSTVESRRKQIKHWPKEKEGK
jgi:hypothetical protein